MSRWRPIAVLVGLLLSSMLMAVLLLPGWSSFRTQDLVGSWQDASGKPLPDGTKGPDYPLVVHTTRGSRHCDWGHVIFLDLSWPPGTLQSGPLTDAVRQYVRDPSGRLAGHVLDPYDGSVGLPRAATPTGFHRFGNQIFVDPNGSAYVRRPSGVVERWGRAYSLLACS